MSNTGSFTQPVTPVYTFKQHHFHWGILILIFLFGGVAVFMYYYGARADIENGRLAVTAPNFDSLKDRIVIKTSEGPVVAQVQQPAPAQPNGQTINYGFDPNGQPQRIQVNRFGIYDKLSGDIESLAGAVKAQGDGVFAALKAQADIQKATSDNVGKLADSQKNANARIDEIDGKFGSLNDKVDGLGNKVADLEKKQAAPAPVQPEAQPTTPAPPATSQTVPGPSTQAVPAPVAPPAISQAVPQPSEQAVPVAAPSQKAAGVTYTGVPARWHIGKVHGEAKAESCAAKGGTLRLADYRKGQCSRLPNGGYNCKWFCDSQS